MKRMREMKKSRETFLVTNFKAIFQETKILLNIRFQLYFKIKSFKLTQKLCNWRSFLVHSNFANYSGSGGREKRNKEKLSYEYIYVSETLIISRNTKKIDWNFYFS